MYFSLIETSCRGIYRKMNKNKEIQNQLPVGVLHKKWFLRNTKFTRTHMYKSAPETPAPMFFYKFCKIFKNTNVLEHLQIAASKK